MTPVLPQTAADVLRQIDHYQWIKTHLSADWYARIVEMAEQRPERAR